MALSRDLCLVNMNEQWASGGTAEPSSSGDKQDSFNRELTRGYSAPPPPLPSLFIVTRIRPLTSFFSPSGASCDLSPPDNGDRAVSQCAAT
ncbi:hypothetical protein JZ751_001471 [Albula glossodonta]|uniref:Uncharacterized protein n=1 Tax=Albula glossodonta TaxID=121402 RepID=A0A8T2PU21_9TELE|nr:hypothetical protein JZ751_001471 [Albula glossodonta]